jgi:predicted RND superfamily exporter protein
MRKNSVIFAALLIVGVLTLAACNVPPTSNEEYPTQLSLDNKTTFNSVTSQTGETDQTLVTATTDHRTADALSSTLTDKPNSLMPTTVKATTNNSIVSTTSVRTTAVQTTNESREKIKARFQENNVDSEDLRVLYENNSILLNEIAYQMIASSRKYYTIGTQNRQIYAKGQNWEDLPIEVWVKPLLDEYGSVVGDELNAASLRLLQEYSVVDFTFRHENRGYIILCYSPQYRNDSWEHIEGSWYIYYELFV